MPPAIIAAGIGAVTAVGGAALSANAQKNAAASASKTAADTASSNNALARDIYSQNQQVFAPFQQRGNAAGQAINSLLGLGGPDMQRITSNSNVPAGGYMGGSGIGDGMIERQYGAESMTTEQPMNTMAASPQQDYNKAFQNYQNSTGYQFRVGEGVRALDAAAAAGGVRNSGAAQKSLAKYGQNIASGEFNNYLALLANQQGVGLSGASAQAGVGQNYANNVTANNNSAGTAAANAQLFRGQANANMWGNVGSAMGTFASSFG